MLTNTVLFTNIFKINDLSMRNDKNAPVFQNGSAYLNKMEKPTRAEHGFFLIAKSRLNFLTVRSNGY